MKDFDENWPFVILLIPLVMLVGLVVSAIVMGQAAEQITP